MAAAAAAAVTTNRRRRLRLVAEGGGTAGPQRRGDRVGEGAEPGAGHGPEDGLSWRLAHGGDDGSIKPTHPRLIGSSALGWQRELDPRGNVLRDRAV